MIVFSLAIAAGCTSSGQHGGSPATNIASLSVAPANQTLVIDGTTPATSAYHVTATYADGHTADVTAQASFALDRPSLGAFSANQFSSTTDLGGAANVVATVGGATGKTQLTLMLRQRYVDPGSMGLPGNPGTLFGGAPTPSLAATLVYPNDGVLVPPNLGKLEIHWKPAAGTSLFALAFANPVTDVEVYVACTNPTNGGCIYLPDAKLWRWVAETNRGGSPVQVSIRATDGKGGGVGTSGKLSVSFSHDDIHGGLYYWTTSNGTGIMRFDFASTTQTVAQKFIGTDLTGGTCVGCHALSRDGKKLVAEAGGQNDGRVLLLDVAAVMPKVPFASTPKSIFESWEASGDRYVGVYGDSGATDFNLQLFSGANGSLLGPIAGTGTQTNPADHPDWSPDGKSITYVKVGTPGTMQRMWSGAIELLTSPDGMTWAPPAELVPSVAGKNHYYPAFSPDGGFIIYDESTCPAGMNTDAGCNADTDATATLWAVAAKPGAKPISLGRCNAGGVLDGGKTALTNSFPRWSPFVFAGSGEFGSRLEWVTFSTARNYGLRPPPPSPNPGGESPVGTLIWMAAIDPDKVLAGEDGCYAAFALPFQDVGTSNHIAQWTTQVVPPIQ